MSVLKLSALLLVALGGCVLPYDDGRGRGYERSGYYNSTGPTWRDGPQHEHRRDDDRRNEDRRDNRDGDRNRFDRR